MSNWEEYGFEQKIQNILSGTGNSGNHHFKNAYLTSYQIAIEFNQNYSSIVNALGLSEGGLGSEVTNSLAKYIAHELSQRIKKNTIVDIEGAFLSMDNFKEINFDGVVSPITPSGTELSMFRIK